MALQDFIQSLQEQDIVYSTPPQPSIRVIPPENQCIKIIPPESVVANPPAPKVIKLKIKQKPVNVEPQIPNNQSQQTVQKPQQQKPILQPVSKPNKEIVEHTVEPIVQPTIQQKQETIPKYTPPNTKPNIETPTQITDDDIFNSTGTEYSKKSIWMEYFIKAKNSRKSNPIADRMKLGRFTITPDNKVLILPDYDIVGKDPDDVLKDKWF